jgi:tetratricopeptide (TPR) repeat protein
VEEENIARGAVTVTASLDAGATWTPLAEGVDPPAGDEAGRYAGEVRFTMPSVETEKLLLRITAMDAAGNTGEVGTDPKRPITIRNSAEDGGRKAEEHYHRGVVLLRSSDPADRSRAIESFRRALIYRPDHAAAHHDLGLALEAASPTAAGGAEEALGHYRKACAAAPDDPRIAFGLVAALIRRAEAAANETAARPLLDEAEGVFRKVSWTRLVEATRDPEESGRLRRQYREWKERYFTRVPR